MSGLWIQDNVPEASTVRDFGAAGAVQPALSSYAARVGGAGGAVGFGEIVVQEGSWLMGSAFLSTTQGLVFRGRGYPTIRWDGAAAQHMFQLRDSTHMAFHDLCLLGKNGAVPASAIFYDDTNSITLDGGTNERLLVDNCRIGRRHGTDIGNTTGMVRGIYMGGPNSGNNDQYCIRNTSIWDCTTAGIDIVNDQSIWGSLENVLMDTCGYGLQAGSNIQGWNLQFNRNTVADFAPFRDTIHHIRGFNSENAARLIAQSQNASVYIEGGKSFLSNTLMTDAYWATFAATKDVVFNNWLVDPGATSGKKVQFTASSAQRSNIRVRGCRLPNGDLRTGYEFIAGASTCGHRFNIRQGGFRLKGTLDGSQTYDLASLADGATALVSQAQAAGAGLLAGDGVLVSLAVDLQGISLSGNCYANTLLYARFHNETGGTLDLASAKLKWRKLGSDEVMAKASLVHDYGVIADDGFEDATITVPCNLGDFVYWGATLDVRSALMSAYVSAANTVKLNLTNLTGGNLNLASATYYAYVVRPEVFDFIGAAVVDPASIADNDGLTITVPCVGARVGDMALAALSASLAGMAHTVYVSADDTVSIRFHNASGVAVDLTSMVARVGVLAMPS